MSIPPPTSTAALQAAITRVRDSAREFARLSLDERIALLRSLRDGYFAIAEESVRLACAYKGHDLDSPHAGEEWLAGPMVTLRVLRLTEQTLRDLKETGAPRLSPKWLRQLPGGRLAVRVMPSDRFDGVLLSRHVGECYMMEGVTAQNLEDHQASFYKTPHQGRVCVVLGGGNVNAIPPTDVISKMFVEGTVCLLKMNPVNGYLGPLIERAFAPLIARGFLAVVHGGAAEGSVLVNHPSVDEVHITGSDKTHDALVWGPAGPEREARKAKNDPLLKKVVTSELGNITPCIVVPGPWDAASLDSQARSTAGMVCNNASFNCNAAKLLVTSRAWSQRQDFLDRLAGHLATGGVRKAWYPGAAERWKAFTEGRKDLKVVGTPQEGHLPYALITDVDRAQLDDKVWSQEPWCTVLSETALETGDVPAFCEEATSFLNGKVWGTLAAMVLVHPETMQAPKHAEAVERMIRELRYGTVAVNTWAGAAFALGHAPWGGHPGSTLADIQSGRGWVHNTFMLEDIEKFVLRGPVRAFPLLPWFAGHRSAHRLGRRLTELEYAPSWLKVPGVAMAGLTG